MISWRPRANRQWLARLSVASLIVLTLAVLTTDAATSQQSSLTVSASPDRIAADGGKTTITVRIGQADAQEARDVALRTDLGAFQTDSGSPAITVTLSPVGGGLLSGSATLVGDGRVGTATVTARIGSTARVTVELVGDPAKLQLEQPASGTRLDATRQHTLRLNVLDDRGVGVPNAPVTLEITEGPENASLRSGDARLLREVMVDSALSGAVTAFLRSDPGMVQIAASSGDISLSLSFDFYGEPSKLLLVPVNGESIARGDVGEDGSIQAQLLDERGRGVPEQRLTFSVNRGLIVAADGDGESRVTDENGQARVHLDARLARFGPAKLSVAWSGADETLMDELDIAVTGEPVAMYLTAELHIGDVGVPLIEEYAASTRYRVRALVVDEYGQRVGGSHQVRWRARISGAGAQVYPEVSVTENGMATAIFDLEHAAGSAKLDTVVQAWLIAKAQVNNRGSISDLLGSGVPLRVGWNELIWRGETISVSDFGGQLGEHVSSVWRHTIGTAWQAWFPAGVPGAADFDIEPGDRFHLVLDSALLLESVERVVTPTP